MQVIKYEAHNVLGVKDIKFDLAGRHLFLVGGANDQGKSSALTALVMALAGKSGMDDYPEIALRKGEKKGKVTIELAGDGDSITVELSLKQKPSGEVIEEFRVLDSSGKKATEPRKLLQKLFTLRAFDPLAFERMESKEKATLVQKMLGLDLSKFDKEHAKVFEERTILGREGKNLASQFEAAIKYEDVPEEEIKVADLMSELETLHVKSKERSEFEKLADNLELRQSDLSEEADVILKEIAALNENLEKIKEQIGAAAEGEKNARKKLDSLQDPAADIAAVKTKITKADEINSKVRANVEYSKLESSLKKSRGEYQKHTDRLKAIQEERAEAVANAKWPMSGMSLTEDGLLMDGIPFEQACTSQRIMASVKVGMALNPKLRLLVCQHGSDLDNATLDALAKVVEENKFQFICEVVTRTMEDEERCAVVIADGEVVGAEKASDMDESSDMEEDSSEESKD